MPYKLFRKIAWHVEGPWSCCGSAEHPRRYRGTVPVGHLGDAGR